MAGGDGRGYAGLGRKEGRQGGTRAHGPAVEIGRQFGMDSLSKPVQPFGHTNGRSRQPIILWLRQKVDIVGFYSSERRPGVFF